MNTIYPYRILKCFLSLSWSLECIIQDSVLIDSHERPPLMSVQTNLVEFPAILVVRWAMPE